MKKLLFILYPIMLISCTESAKKECIDKTKISSDALCKDDYAPVCGCDGKKYTNVCQAKNAGVTSWDEGDCPKNK